MIKYINFTNVNSDDSYLVGVESPLCRPLVEGLND